MIGERRLGFVGRLVLCLLAVAYSVLSSTAASGLTTAAYGYDGSVQLACEHSEPAAAGAAQVPVSAVNRFRATDADFARDATPDTSDRPCDFDSRIGPAPTVAADHLEPSTAVGSSEHWQRHNVVRAFHVAAKTETAVIGKVADLEKGVGANEYTLLDQLPNMGSPELNWKQNSGVLRKVMSRGQPIRDASVGADGQLIQYPGSFLNAERYLLQDRGWSFDPKSGYWMPPG